MNIDILYADLNHTQLECGAFRDTGETSVVRKQRYSL